MPSYSKAGGEIRQVVADVMRSYHGRLVDVGVLIDVLVARPSVDQNGDAVGPAVVLHGYACAAKIRVLGLKDRVARNADAEMVIDGDGWDVWSAERRAAVVDHELTHLELGTDADGNVRRDDADRPRLRRRRHDRHFGWFDSVAARHGQQSIEVDTANRMFADREFRQTYLFDVGLTEPELGDEGDNAMARRNVRCADGRMISAREMLNEVVNRENRLSGDTLLAANH